MGAQIEYIRGFRRRGRAWYGGAVPRRADVSDYVTLGLFARDGTATRGEFRIEWVGAGGMATARLNASESSWHALAQFKDVLDEIGRPKARPLAPGTLCVMLQAHGILDMARLTSEMVGPMTAMGI